ncbi:type IV pilin protein [Cupriavidus sp. KB_39]|uniref:type IV pilin protein n=1 Tax=Cupriavidus sp. KB_39 TaxID=3233036 RepID=UPI003F912747
MTRTGLRQRMQGFTLIELMITVMVLGILAAIAYPQYGQYVTKARRTEAKAALARVQGAQERYFTVNNKYSSDPAQLKVLACAAQTTGSGDTCDQGSHVITIAVTGGADATGYIRVGLGHKLPQNLHIRTRFRASPEAIVDIRSVRTDAPCPLLHPPLPAAALSGAPAATSSSNH